MTAVAAVTTVLVLPLLVVVALAVRHRTALAPLLRTFWQQQVHLQERYDRRVDTSGSEALAAVRTLRWRDGRLVGEVLPERPEQAA